VRVDELRGDDERGWAGFDDGNGDFDGCGGGDGLSYEWG
jgi:hypothetical protein